MKTFRFIADAGHGWLRVPITLLYTLEITDKISNFSMVSPGGVLVYLEEDCDYAIFTEAYVKKYGDFKERVTYVDGLWHGRRFERYSPFRFTAPPENREVLKSDWTAVGYTTPF